MFLCMYRGAICTNSAFLLRLYSLFKIVTKFMFLPFFFTFGIMKIMNYIWFFIILISIISAAITGRMNELVNAVLSGAKNAIDVSLYLAGIMAFWLGIMKIAEKSELVNLISKLFTPIAKFLFPSVPKDSPVIGDVAMNFTANALGVANAATPIGIQALKGLQTLNHNKNSASNDMCMLVAMNTAGFQLVPATVIAILAANGAKNPTDIVIPTLIVTTISFLSAILIAKVLEKIMPPQISENNQNNTEDLCQ